MKELKIKIMGKRGEGFTVSQLITLVLAVVILAIIVITLYEKYVNGVWWWAKNLPVPEVPCIDGPGCEGISIEIVRYSIGEDEVQYYTGTEWRDFPEEGLLKFGNKITYKENLERNFREAYYAEGRDRALEIIPLKDGKGLIGNLMMGPKDFDKRGIGGTEELRAYADVEVKYNSGESKDDYIVNYNDKMYKITPKSAKAGTELQEHEVAGKAFVDDKKLPNGQSTLTLTFKSLIKEDSLFSQKTEEYIKELSGKTFSFRKDINGPPSIIKIPKGKNDKYEFKLIYIEKEDGRGLSDNHFIYNILANGINTGIEARYSAYYYGALSKWEDNLGNGEIYAMPIAKKIYNDVGMNENEKKIAEQVGRWRESILRKPIRIEYATKIEKGKEPEIFASLYCGNMLSINKKRYVTAYLDKPTEKAECEIAVGGNE